MFNQFRNRNETPPTELPTTELEKRVDLLEEQIPHLRRYARYLTNDADQADDMVQDCLVRAIENFEKWEPGTNLRAWLIVILRNNFFNHCRRARKEREIKSDPGIASSSVTPASQEDSLSLDELTIAFGELSDEHREVIYLISIDGMKYEDAADVLDINIGTIKSRLSRARSELRQLLDGRSKGKIVSLHDVRSQRSATHAPSSAPGAQRASSDLTEQLRSLLNAS